MTTFIDKDGSYHSDTATVRACPHCGAQAQLVPAATPSYATVAARRPSQVPFGFFCSACGTPRFGRASVRSIDPSRVELASTIVEVERGKEQFPGTYLPDDVRLLFDEALTCYAADVPNAFGSMCRRTLDAGGNDSTNRAAYRDAFDEVVRIGEIDAPTAQTLARLLFDGGDLPLIDAGQAAVLIEIMKDILYQCHVRVAKLHAAMRMRRFFAEEAHEKVTSFRRPRGSARSA